MRSIIRIYAMILLTVVVIIALVWLWGYKQNLPAPGTRPSSDFVTAIFASHQELFSKDNQPVFTIKDIKKPIDNWYVLKITPKDRNDPESFIIINDPYFSTDYMSVVAGPESKFSRKELQRAKILIPDAVTNTLVQEGAL